ncbi:MAG: hypothetical protein LIP77_03605 [Planctomycetes bacterium]|nr:hypothetical protein [Planctomycetota bacterium]
MHTNDTTSRRLPVAMTGRKRPGKMFLLAVALLLMAAGGAIGSGLTVLHFRSALAAPDGSPEILCHMITNRLSGSVAISPEEMAAIEMVVAHDVSDVTRLRREFDGEVKERLSVMCERICEILGPERAHACTALLPVRDGDGFP